MKKTAFIRSGIIKMAVLLPFILLSIGDAVGKAHLVNTTNGSTDRKFEGVELFMQEINLSYFEKFDSLTPKTDTTKNNEAFEDIEKIPKINGGDPAIEVRKYISQNIR